MVVFKSKIPDVEIPSVGIYQYLLSNPNEISEDKAIFIDGTTDEKLTFTELKSNSKKFAAGLQDKVNFKRGDVLSIFSPNQVDYAVITFGAIAAGGKISPANHSYTVDEYAFQLKDSGTSVIVTHPICLSTAKKAAAVANIPDSKIFHFGDKEIDGILPYSSLFGEREAIPVEYTPEEIKTTTALLCYSSGTTGKQKGVETTHLNVVANSTQILAVDRENTRSEVVYAGALPFFHIYGLGLMLNVLVTGSCVILQKFDLASFCRIIQDYKISYIHVVPPIVLALVKSPIPKEYDLSSLKMVVSGAAPLSKELSENFHNDYKVKIKQGYGLTETTPATHFDITKDSVPGSVGILLPNIDCKLISEDGQEMGYNEPGELCVRGPNVMKGYLNNKKATDAVIDKDGYFHTGDVATVDENGHFYIIDRVKELIKYKGYQVVPAELEAVLLSHPSISDAAVIGIYSEQEATEHPVAYVVLQSNIQPTSKLSQEIKNFVHEKVAPHKRLRGGIVYIDQIPKSASGKILRRILRDKHSNNIQN